MAAHLLLLSSNYLNIRLRLRLVKLYNLYGDTILRKLITIFNLGKYETEEKIPNVVEMLQHTIEINS